MEFETQKIESFPEKLQYQGKKVLKNEDAFELVNPLDKVPDDVGSKPGKIPNVPLQSARNIRKEKAVLSGLKSIGVTSSVNALKAKMKARTRKVKRNNGSKTMKNNKEPEIVIEVEPEIPAEPKPELVVESKPEIVVEPKPELFTEPTISLPPSTPSVPVELKQNVKEVLEGKRILPEFPSAKPVEKPETTFEKVLSKLLEKTKGTQDTSKAFAELYAKIYVYFLALYLHLEEQGIKNEVVTNFLQGKSDFQSIPSELLDPSLKDPVLNKIKEDPEEFRRIVEDQYFTIKPRGEGNEEFKELLLDIPDIVDNLEKLSQIL